MSHQNFGSDPQFASNNVSYWHLSDIPRSHEMSALTQRGRVLSSPAIGGKADMTFNTAEGWARDVTEDIARALLDDARAAANSRISSRVLRVAPQKCRQT